MAQIPGMDAELHARIIPRNTILLGYRGSLAHGTYLDPDHPESVDDRDLMGVSIGGNHGLSAYLGTATFEQKAVQEDVWDSVVYDLKKFVRLLSNGNPNVLCTLWMRPQDYLILTPEGRRLIDNRDLFRSKRRARDAFYGYAYGQLERMSRNSKEGYMGAKREALVNKFGYDCKNASHCIRILRMGIEYLRTGSITVFRPDARELVDIKTGKWTLEKVKEVAERSFAEVDLAYQESTLPEEPNLEAIDRLCVELVSSYFSL